MHQPVRPANRRKYGSNRERPHGATHRETTTNSAARNNSTASAGPNPIGLGSGKSALSRFDNIEAYILPKMIPVDSAAYTLEDQQRMRRAKNYFAWQHRLIRKELGRRVLEVGCGVGNFTAMLLDRDAVVAVDVQPECIEQLKLRY